MNQGESITSYFMRINELRDQLSSIGFKHDDKELAMTTLNGLPLTWDVFIQVISEHSELPTLDRQKTDCHQEEVRLISRGSIFKEDIQLLYSQNFKRGIGKFKKKR